MACYLDFNPSSGGTLLAVWSETAVEDALAVFVPSTKPPRFKITSNGGRSEIGRGVGGPNKKKYFSGWVSFIRQAASFGGMLALLML